MTYISIDALKPILDHNLRQAAPRQIQDQSHPHAGAFVSTASGLPEPQPTAGFITNAVFHALITDDAESLWIEPALRAADALPRMARPSGLFDLVNVNPDSAPDTGFILQYLCGAVELARDLASPALQRALSPLLDKIEATIRAAMPGMLTGGFHTPNHRWVMTAAMAQAIALYPDLDERGAVSQAIQAYLAESFDIDDEGTFIERSVGVYDAVNTRSLLLIAANWPDDEVRQVALDAVRRNLEFDFYLLHADGSAETGLSRRQDYGTRSVAIGLIPSLLLYNRSIPSPDCVAMAHHLWRNYRGMGEHLIWIIYALLRGGDPQQSDGDADNLLPTDFARHFPLNGIWRVRRELLSASAFEGVTRLFGLTFGEAELTSLKIAQTYFGGPCGHFVSDSLRILENGTENGSVLLRSEGQGRPRRPGYELPIGRAIVPTEWNATMTERDLRTLDPIRGELTIEEVQAGESGASPGFDLRYVTQSGLDQITCQIALDFPEGGIWETADTRLQPVAGQVVFLKQGWGQMRYNNDVIRIDLGDPAEATNSPHSTKTDAHATWAMRDAETAPNHVRVLITLITPVDFSWRIRAFRGL